MRLEDQVCSLELAKKLKSLGVKQESLFYWCNDGEIDHWYLAYCEKGVSPDAIKNNWVYSAFTLAELGEMLPDTFESYKLNQSRNNFVKFTQKWNCYYQINGGVEYGKYQLRRINFNADTEANARAKMLVYLLENNLITL